MSDGREQPSGKVVIKVVGVGGGGCNAVSRMIEKGSAEIEYIALNTDAQALAKTQADRRLLIGEKVTQGLGAGGSPELGFQAASASAQEITAVLQGADLIFVTAGMGGGTGTGAAPVVSKLARETGALTVGLVTLPFAFEGTRRVKLAQCGLAGMQQNVDTLIVIPNDRLMACLDMRASLLNAFGLADGILRQGVEGISDLITRPGMINLDFADVRAIMGRAGTALISVGRASGVNRAELAAEQAISNELLDVTIQGASGVLFNITGGPDMTLHEINLAAEKIRAGAHPDANVIFGAAIDPDLGDEIRIMLVATGGEKKGSGGPVAAQVEQNPVPSTVIPSRISPEPYAAVFQPAISPEPAAVPLDSVFAPRVVDTDDLDIPAFLRQGAGRSYQARTS